VQDGVLMPRGAKWLSVHETVVNSSGEYKTFTDLRRDAALSRDRKARAGNFVCTDHLREVNRRDMLAKNNMLNDHGFYLDPSRKGMATRKRGRAKWLAGDFKLA
jgi:hypothetical protein